MRREVSTSRPKKVGREQDERISLRDVTYEISYRSHLIPDDEDIYSYCSFGSGRILLVDDEGETVEIGNFSFDLIDCIRAESAELDPIDVFDCQSAELSYLYGALFKVGTYELQETVFQKLFPDMDYEFDSYDRSDIMYLKTFALLPKFRGQKIASYLIEKIFSDLGGLVQMMVVNANPILRYESEHDQKAMVPPKSKREIAKSKAAVRRFYKRLGFSLIPQDPTETNEYVFMARAKNGTPETAFSKKLYGELFKFA
ncbi:MAG: hypothetical protein EOP06_01180 [Proteobacteria bacterium]|nr:MAG: hypothetical protein EOP06_01180 [Pseudomonadota bacterium]